MPLVTLREILAGATTEGYAVAAFNDVNALYARPILRAAEKAGSPVILMVAEVHFTYVDLEEMAPYLVHVCRRARVPVCLMLDHGASRESAARAIAAGFTAVMFDGSRLSYEENVARTREVVALARPAGVSVEGELGHVAGHEGGAAGALSDRRLTDPEQAREFVESTGVDCLAVSVGTKHGFYDEEVHLDFALLARLRGEVPVPLAIHGGSGLSDADFRALVSHGAAKINYYTGMAANAARTARSVFQRQPQLLHLPDLLREVEATVEAEASHVYEVLGSAGRAGATA
ncbi:MAG: class II fructose-bisphosphate aldolase [Chitinophagales bacterium]